MKKTCGIYLINKNDKLLITHPTNHPYFGSWSIPKGVPDKDDESFLDTAIRELREETGIDLKNIIMNKNIKIHYLPSVVYKSNKKTFYSFLIIDKELDDVKVVCESHAIVNGVSFPENDDYKWVHISHTYMLKQYLHEPQLINFDEIVKIFNNKLI